MTNQRSAYDALSANNKRLVDTSIALRFSNQKVYEGTSLAALRERGADNIESLIRSKTAIEQDARAAGIKPNDPTASFPEALKLQMNRGRGV